MKKKLLILTLMISISTFCAIPQIASADFTSAHLEVEASYDADTNSLLAFASLVNNNQVEISDYSFSDIQATIWPRPFDYGQGYVFDVEEIQWGRIPENAKAAVLLLNITPEIQSLITNNPGVYHIYLRCYYNYQGQSHLVASSTFINIPGSGIQSAILDGVSEVNSNVASTQVAVQNVGNSVTAGNQGIQNHLNQQDSVLNSHTTKLNSLISTASSIFSKVNQIYNFLTGGSSSSGSGGGGSKTAVIQQ